MARAIAGTGRAATEDAAGSACQFVDNS